MLRGSSLPPQRGILSPRSCRRNNAHPTADAPRADLLAVTPGEPLLALRVGDLEFALERGRTYRIGSDEECDLRIPHPDPIALVARLTEHGVEVMQAASGAMTMLRLHGSASLSGIECSVALDEGQAVLLPDPALRQLAQRARQTVVRKAPQVRRTETPLSFADLMANELRRTPWLVISIALHAALFAIAWVMFGSLPTPERPPARYGYQVAIAADETAVEAPEHPAVVPESLDAIEPDMVVELAGGNEPTDEPPPPDIAPADDPLLSIGGARVPNLRASDGDGNGAGVGAGAGSGDGDALAGGKGSGGFRKTVTELRRTGLDVVFVFDSTGSMGGSIRATKDGIAQMLDVLRALVPDARFGLVTYRDKGSGEDYLVRTLPLGRDFYAAVNWMQTIEADGGGDTPEAVFAGLRAAFGLDYRRGAKRVVVVAGDAPPHQKDMRALGEAVRRFSADPSSSVHALLTNGDKGTAADSFAAIAKAGRGVCCPIEDQRKLLRQVLTLAFGSQFERDLDEVQQRLAAERSSPPTWARDLARRGGPDLAAALAGDAAPSALVHALLRPQASRAALLELVAQLSSSTTSNAAKQAAAHVLQMRLSLKAPPVDADNPRPIPSSIAADLRQRVLALPE